MGPQLGAEAYLHHMRVDKKAEAGDIRFVLIERPGSAVVDDVHAHIAALLARGGAHIDAYYYCPHHPDGLGGRVGDGVLMSLRIIRSWVICS